MNSQEKLIKKMKPSPIPREIKSVFYAGLIFSGFFGILIFIFSKNVLNSIVVIFIFTIFMPGVIILAKIGNYLRTTIYLYDDKVIVKDNSWKRVLIIERTQEMKFNEIEFIYHLSKEKDYIKALWIKIKKYTKGVKENDLRTENLVKKYGVPAEVLEEFNKGVNKLLNDDTSTGVLMLLDSIFDEYKVPKLTRKP